MIELYSLRWQIELFFKELKSTLGFSQYSFQSFQAVRAWVETALTTVLFDSAAALKGFIAKTQLGDSASEGIGERTTHFPR